MRYIDSAQVTLPDGWLQRAATAAKAVAGGAKVDDYASVWRELKNGLADLFHDKCWYCEVPVVRSDNAVDHFRPKGRVAGTPKAHGGYTWLAFDQTNFRYACTWCNSRRIDQDGGTAGGKADLFPLLDETQRVYKAGAVTGEKPELLDPCEMDDWRALGCMRENGKPCPAGDDPVLRKRAETSISVLHLHHEPTCKLRHARAVTLMADIDEARRLFTAARTDPARELDFKKVAQRILRSIARKSEFSGDMRFLLGGERTDDHPWIQGLLET